MLKKLLLLLWVVYYSDTLGAFTLSPVYTLNPVNHRGNLAPRLYLGSGEWSYFTPRLGGECCRLCQWLNFEP